MTSVFWATAPIPTLPLDEQEAAPALNNHHAPARRNATDDREVSPGLGDGGCDVRSGGRGAEQAQHLPGLAELFETENPGMHTTEPVDYDIVLEGEIWLELDNGA